MTRQRHPRGLASRFFLAQAIVVAAGILAAVAVASLAGPAIFHEHLIMAGHAENSPELLHVERAYRDAGLIVLGVALGTAAGLTGYLTGEGFLAASGVKILGYGLSTTLVFDMGVYLCVLGLVVAAFTLLGPDTVEEAPDDGDAPEKAAPGAATTREEATR